MTDTNTTVTLKRSDWRKVLCTMDMGISQLQDEGFVKVTEQRERLYDDIEEQVMEQYDGNPETLDDVLSVLEDECGIERSLCVEEIGRAVANLQD